MITSTPRPLLLPHPPTYKGTPDHINTTPPPPPLHTHLHGHTWSHQHHAPSSSPTHTGIHGHINTTPPPPPSHTHTYTGTPTPRPLLPSHTHVVPGWCILSWILMNLMMFSFRAGIRGHKCRILDQISSPKGVYVHMCCTISLQLPFSMYKQYLDWAYVLKDYV